MMATTETNTTNKNDADNQVSHGFTNQNVWNQHPTTNQSSSSESASNSNETSMNISEMTMGGSNQNALEALASLASNAHTRLSIPSSSFNSFSPQLPQSIRAYSYELYYQLIIIIFIYIMCMQ
jgi:hypothetical protein